MALFGQILAMKEAPEESVLRHDKLPTPEGVSPLGRIFEAGSVFCSREGGRKPALRRYPAYAIVCVTGTHGGQYLDGAGVSEELEAGDCLLLHPARPHRYWSAKASWSDTYISFDGPAFSLLDSCGLWSADRHPVLKGRGGMVAPRINRCLFDRRGMLPMSLAVPRVLGLAAELCAIRDAGDAGSDWVKTMTDALGREGATVAGVCKVLGEQWSVESSALRKRYRRATGRSPETVRLEARLLRTLPLVERGDDPFKRVAAAMGFANEQHLSRTVKAATGFTPLELRRRAHFPTA